MARKRAVRLGLPAGYPPYPAAGARKSQPIPEIPSITVQTNALAAGDTVVIMSKTTICRFC